MEVFMGHPLTDDLGFLLSRASGAVVRATNAALVAHGLRVRQYSVLVLACDAAEGVTQRELADVLGLDPSQVVLLVDELTGRGLVERRPSEADRRTRLVLATDAGHEVRAAAERDAAVAVEGPLGLLAEAERDRLRDVLTRIWTAAG
ncbi:DNA-binding transcriptional regulator, MarR family [Klenkia marina]|uniref:DNA-binding transcriptional regulator, MarR family n=1 Tax=Klenkia marina TaxID=1960309 RepID=A0A1G4XGQ3_9ACTN|nr:MarR family transcriptional regulator [Klenkia marina]SCX40389.1 DNA-binding transcriptional regulator, MarR family [Klenkia marina]